MDYLWEQIQFVNETHKFTEKRLLVPSYGAGRSMLISMATAGYSFLNLHPTTFGDLVSPRLPPGITQVSDSVLNHLVWEIMQERQQQGDLKYFGSDHLSYSVAQAISGSIRELKCSGQTSTSLTEMSLVSTSKKDDLVAIFADYETALNNRKWVDRADALRLSKMAYDKEAPRFVLMAFDTLQPTVLESELLRLLSQKTPCYLLASPWVHNLQTKRTRLFPGFRQAAVPPRDDSPMQRLYDVTNYVGPTPTYAIYGAYGASNEVREVLRRIKGKQVPLDTVAVFTSVQEPYNQLFWELAQQFQIPITFGHGVRITNFRPGRLLSALLAWVQENYAVSVLIRMLQAGDVHLAEGSPSAGQMVRILRESGVGWSRDRYELIVEQGDRQGNSQDEVAASDASGIKTATHGLIQDMLAEIPSEQADGTVNYAQFLAGMRTIVERYARITSEGDGQARKAIVDTLQELADTVVSSLSLREALHRIQSVLAALRIGSSPPQAGHLHVDGLPMAAFLNRSYAFVVGLDGTRFGGVVDEDPILLDIERETVKGLPLRRMLPPQREADVVTALSQQKGKVTFSYATFDTADSRELFPSSLLLQLHRLQTSHPTKDYSDFMDDVTIIGFLPQDRTSALGLGEAWLKRLEYGTLLGRERVLQSFTNLAHGEKASQQRLRKTFNPYLGRLAPHRVSYQGRPLSASQLEMLGCCPFQFLLRYVLGVKPLEELVYDASVWLDPMRRGTLLHGVFETYYRQVVAAHERPSLTKHQAELETIVVQHLDRMRREVPPPSEMVYESEAEEIRQSALVFLKSEEETPRGCVPQFFELSFGLSQVETDSDQEAHAVPIKLPSGRTFLLRGKIDRVDRCEEGYVVLDYKTGSTFAYHHSDFVKGGRQLQHTLYAMAFEQIAQTKGWEPGDVIAAGYAFPSLKGEGQRVLRPQNQRALFCKVLDYLLQLVEEGVFVMSDDQKDCRFCDYEIVCERSRLQDVWQALFDKDLPEFVPFKAVRDHA